jgi:hypothetical protein
MIVNINPKHEATFVIQQFMFLLKVVLDCFPFYVHIIANYAVVVISTFCFTFRKMKGLHVRKHLWTNTEINTRKITTDPF